MLLSCCCVLRRASFCAPLQRLISAPCPCRSAKSHPVMAACSAASCRSRVAPAPRHSRRVPGAGAVEGRAVIALGPQHRWQCPAVEQRLQDGQVATGCCLHERSEPRLSGGSGWPCAQAAARPQRADRNAQPGSARSSRTSPPSVSVTSVLSFTTDAPPPSSSSRSLPQSPFCAASAARARSCRRRQRFLLLAVCRRGLLLRPQLLHYQRPQPLQHRRVLLRSAMSLPVSPSLVRSVMSQPRRASSTAQSA